MSIEKYNRIRNMYKPGSPCKQNSPLNKETPPPPPRLDASGHGLDWGTPTSTAREGIALETGGEGGVQKLIDSMLGLHTKVKDAPPVIDPETGEVIAKGGSWRAFGRQRRLERKQKQEKAKAKNLTKIEHDVDVDDAGEGVGDAEGGDEEGEKTPTTMKYPFKQNDEEYPGWSDTASDLAAVKQGHEKTLESFKEAGVSDTDPDVQKVMSQIEQSSKDIAEHEEKLWDRENLKKFK